MCLVRSSLRKTLNLSNMRMSILYKSIILPNATLKVSDDTIITSSIEKTVHTK